MANAAEKHPGLSGLGLSGLFGPGLRILAYWAFLHFWASVYSKAKILTILLFSLIHRRNLVPSVKQVWWHVRFFNDSAEPEKVQNLGTQCLIARVVPQRGGLAMIAHGGVRAMFLGLKLHLKAIFLGLKSSNMNVPFFGAKKFQQLPFSLSLIM